MGSNSTRLLIADVAPTLDDLTELHREMRVTRLARGVDGSAQLAAEAIEDVCAVVGDYLEIAAEHGAETTAAIATSAVRDATNGDAFLAELRERFALEARAIDGETEARLTYRGATAARLPGRRAGGRSGSDAGPILVFDIGGGSTELIIGAGAEPGFRTSLQLGVVRQSERFLPSDPPAPEQLEALANAVSAELTRARNTYGGPSPTHAIAVAGTPTSLAAIELELDPYDGDAVEGHVLELGDLQRRLPELATLSLPERRQLVGLHPDRAPTIVCGTVILIGTMRAFGLERIEVSEHDILWGAAFDSAGRALPPAPG